MNSHTPLSQLIAAIYAAFGVDRAHTLIIKSGPNGKGFTLRAVRMDGSTTLHTHSEVRKP